MIQPPGFNLIYWSESEVANTLAYYSNLKNKKSFIKEVQKRSSKHFITLK
jgi:hypothetical protein